VEKEIETGDIKLYGVPEPIEYEGNKLLDSFVKRYNILEFNPTKVKDFKNWETKKENIECSVGEENGRITTV